MSFARFARYISFYAGSPAASCSALALAVLWIIAGPIVGWSAEWHLWASSVTTVITFLMVFNIQSTQSRDTAELKAMLREICEDVTEVDEVKAHDRAEEEEKP